MAKNSGSAKDRQHFRIKYPPSYRPELVSDGRTHTLVDLSVAGLKFEFNGTYLPKPDTEITATIGFKSGARVAVAGQIVRVEGFFVMVKLTKGVPREILKAEADILLAMIGNVPTDTY